MRVEGGLAGRGSARWLSWRRRLAPLATAKRQRRRRCWRTRTKAHLEHLLEQGPGRGGAAAVLAAGMALQRDLDGRDGRGGDGWRCGFRGAWRRESGSHTTKEAAAVRAAPGDRSGGGRGGSDQWDRFVRGRERGERERAGGQLMGRELGRAERKRRLAGSG